MNKRFLTVITIVSLVGFWLIIGSCKVSGATGGGLSGTPLSPVLPSYGPSILVVPGADISSVLLSAASGTTIVLQPGHYTNTSFITVPTNIWLMGYSPLTTIIHNQETNTIGGNVHPGVVLSTDCRVSGVTITNDFLDGFCQAAIGANGARGDKPFLRVYVDNVIVWGDCDGLVISTNGCTATFYKCVFNSKWDAAVHNANNTGLINFVECVGLVTGPSVFNSGQASRTLVSSGGSRINVYGGVWNATNSGAAAYAVAETAGSGNIKLYGGFYRGNANTAPLVASGPNLITVYSASYDELNIDHSLNVLNYGSLGLAITNIFAPVDTVGGANSPIIMIVNDGSNFFTNKFDGNGTFSTTHYGNIKNGSLTVVTNNTGGAGVSAGVVTLDAGAKDARGTVTLTTGASPAASVAIITITFGKAYATAPYVFVTPVVAAGAASLGQARCFITSTVNGFTINSSTTALSSTTQYGWNYWVIE